MLNKETLNKQNIEELKKLDINSLTAEDIEYYKNPLEILRELSTSWNNKIIGEYESPIAEELANVRRS